VSLAGCRVKRTPSSQQLGASSLFIKDRPRSTFPLWSEFLNLPDQAKSAQNPPCKNQNCRMKMARFKPA
jgi:hypothetical protein